MTQQTSQIMVRMVALVYHWWHLFSRLATMKPITSRPLLLSSVGQLTRSDRQYKMVINNTHAEKGKIRSAYARIHESLESLKATATQLTKREVWQQMAIKCVEYFLRSFGDKLAKLLST